jgi:uncharacterized protein (UPF0332 family)
MSPRSEEFLEQARQRLDDARKILPLVHPAVTVTTAYYAMLNAARAALSERGLYAKTHRGTWTLFNSTFVATGEFDRELSALARRAQQARERGDYDADPAEPAEAEELLEGAERFSARSRGCSTDPSSRRRIRRAPRAIRHVCGVDRSVGAADEAVVLRTAHGTEPHESPELFPFSRPGLGSDTPSASPLAPTADGTHMRRSGNRR